MARISKCKVILREPRASDKESFDDVLMEFYEAIKSGHVGGWYGVLHRQIVLLIEWNCCSW